MISVWIFKNARSGGKMPREAFQAVQREHGQNREEVLPPHAGWFHTEPHHLSPQWSVKVYTISSRWAAEQRNEVISLDCTKDGLISKSLFCPLYQVPTQKVKEKNPKHPWDLSAATLCSGQRGSQSLIGGIVDSTSLTKEHWTHDG